MRQTGGVLKITPSDDQQLKPQQKRLKTAFSIPEKAKIPANKFTPSQVLESMNQRPCKENIRTYRKEMKDFKAIMGMSGTSISHGKLKLMRDELLASLRPLNS